MNNRLVILSIPHLRMLRTLLSDIVLDLIKKEADILIISPFSENSKFQKEFSTPGVFFHTPQSLEHLPRWLLRLYGLSELLRRYGYYRRNRHNRCVNRIDGLEFYYKENVLQQTNKKNRTAKQIVTRAVKQFLSMVGVWQHAWRIIDRPLGMLIFRSKSLKAITQPYQQVTLVQAANWGDQDRILAWNARKLGFRTIFVPYSTDQLWCNGYLLCDYHIVCVQGPFEDWCARNFHQVPSSRIISLGSLWFRVLDTFIAKSSLSRNADLKKTTPVVYYVGLSPDYYAREREFEAIDALLSANEKNLLGKIKLVYRPYVLTDEERAEIISRFKGREILLDWGQPACAEMYNYPAELLQTQFEDYIQTLNQLDVVIMTESTSFGWDAAYLGSTVISNFTYSYNEGNKALLFLKNNELVSAPGMLIARSLRELVLHVQQALGDLTNEMRSGVGILTEWDYCSKNWQKLLQEAVYGK